MTRWVKQGPAVIATLSFLDGSRGRIVLMAGRDNPKGAMLVVSPLEGGPVKTLPLAQGLHLLTPDQTVDILCAQERAFGSGRLAPLEVS